MCRMWFPCLFCSFSLQISCNFNINVCAWHCSLQFRHMRMREPRSDMEISNPIYMKDEEDDEEDDPYGFKTAKVCTPYILILKYCRFPDDSGNKFTPFSFFSPRISPPPCTTLYTMTMHQLLRRRSIKGLMRHCSPRTARKPNIKRTMREGRSGRATHETIESFICIKVLFMTFFCLYYSWHYFLSDVYAITVNVYY